MPNIRSGSSIRGLVFEPQADFSVSDGPAEGRLVRPVAENLLWIFVHFFEGRRDVFLMHSFKCVHAEESIFFVGIDDKEMFDVSAEPVARGQFT